VFISKDLTFFVLPKLSFLIVFFAVLIFRGDEVGVSLGGTLISDILDFLLF
jgi:hypothetical protein